MFRANFDRRVRDICFSLSMKMLSPLRRKSVLFFLYRVELSNQCTHEIDDAKAAVLFWDYTLCWEHLIGCAACVIRHKLGCL